MIHFSKKTTLIQAKNVFISATSREVCFSSIELFKCFLLTATILNSIDKPNLPVSLTPAALKEKQNLLKYKTYSFHVRTEIKSIFQLYSVSLLKSFLFLFQKFSTAKKHFSIFFCLQTKKNIVFTSPKHSIKQISIFNILRIFNFIEIVGSGK